MPKRTYAEFLKVWNAPLVTRDAVEEHPWRLIDLVKGLRGRDRERAVAFLCKEIRLRNATLPAIVAGATGLVETVGALEQALARARGWEKAEIAMALGRLTRRRRRTVQALIEAARDGGTRQAVMALGSYRGADVEQALVSALADADLLVRAWAADSLLLATGFRERSGVGFGRVVAYLSSEHPALRRYGAKCLRELERLRAEGASYGELGEDLVVQSDSEPMTQFFRLLNPEEGEPVLDRRLARRLTPAERIWAEYALLRGFLVDGKRVGLPALEIIGAGPSYSVLQDALGGLSGEDRRVASRVLKTLERRRPA